MGLSFPVRSSCRCRVSPRAQNRLGSLCGLGAPLLAGRGYWTSADSYHSYQGLLPAGARCSEGSAAWGCSWGAANTSWSWGGSPVLGRNLQHLMRTNQGEPHPSPLLPPSALELEGNSSLSPLFSKGIKILRRL